MVSDPSGIASAVPFDAAGLRIAGAAVPIVDKLGTSINGDRNLGVSRLGDFAYQSTFSNGARLVLVDRSGGARDAGLDTGLYYGPRLSPDGRRVAAARWTDVNLNGEDVWLLDLVQHTRTRLTFDTVAGSPAWTPDGRRIAFARDVNNSTTSLYWMPADGSGPPEPLLTAAGRWFPAVFEPGGHALLSHGLGPQQTKAEILQVNLVGDHATHPILVNTFHNYDPSLSPDGRWVAYMSDESGRFEVYVRPYPGPGGRWQVSENGGGEPVWSPTGREIFYRDGDRMMSATVRSQGGFEVTGRSLLFEGPYDQRPNRITNYDVTRDGRTFVMLQQVQGTAQSVFVTLNWFDQLRAGRK
jgi:Tol biopolymer transport system component